MRRSRIGPEFDQEWRARFQRFGRTHASEHAVSGWSVDGLQRRVRIFSRLVDELPLPRAARVLELGCGAGTYVRELSARGHRAVGLDYAFPSLARAAAADPERRASYVSADGYALPFRSGSFDLVVCIGVLQALSGPERLLDEIVRVLRPAGVLVVEALNASGVVAMVRRAREILAGRPPRLCFHSVFRVRRWLQERGVAGLRRVGVYLPPRRFASVGRLLDRPGLVGLLEAVPGAALLGAHAFWLVGQTALPPAEAGR
jgi:SAM-dependent methyltransferase